MSGDEVVHRGRQVYEIIGGIIEGVPIDVMNLYFPFSSFFSSSHCLYPTTIKEGDDLVEQNLIVDSLNILG